MNAIDKVNMEIAFRRELQKNKSAFSHGLAATVLLTRNQARAVRAMNNLILAVANDHNNERDTKEALIAAIDAMPQSMVDALTVFNRRLDKKLNNP